MLARLLGYSDEDLVALPEDANMGLSCGNPTAHASVSDTKAIFFKDREASYGQGALWPLSQHSQTPPVYNGTGVGTGVSVGVGTGISVGVELGSSVGVHVGEGNGVDDGSGESGVDTGDVVRECGLQAARATITTSTTIIKRLFLFIAHPLLISDPPPIPGNGR